MKRLRGEALRPGDVILTTTTHAVSKAIRLATRSDISHAIVCVQSHSVIDATAEGVQARNAQRLFFEDECSLYALRYREGLTYEQVEAICTFVRSKVGTEYSTREAIATAVGGTRLSTTKQFCSRLVAQAYQAAGITLVGNPDYCSPADLKASAHFEEVPNAVETVSDREARQWTQRPDITLLMRDATNAFFEGMRSKDPAIQTFDDLCRHVIEHPENDDYVCGLLMSSGYLSVWQAELASNPWHYDLALMNNLPGPDDAIADYCMTTLSGEETGPSRYFVNRAAHADLNRLYQRKTFRTLLALSDRLASLHAKRVDTARKWLQAKGRLTPVAPLLLRPHSAEWFASLEKWDLLQALMTRAVVTAEGRDDVCSICGDTPAADHRIEAPSRPAGGPGTLRLCEDCVRIRAAMGEIYLAIDDL